MGQIEKRTTLTRETECESLRIVSQQVHVFSDASSTGYGAVAYLRQCNDEGRIHCAFLAGKARLAPIKTTTILRLELTAATVSARMGRMLQTELDVDPSFKYHTESTTVLRYIANQQTRFKVFVSNRIQIIRDLSEVNQWTPRRGQDAKSLLENKRWLDRPQFLRKPEEEWPEQPFSMGSVPEDDPEIKATTVSRVTAVTQQSQAVDKLISHYSDWYRLKKAVAVFLRVRKILQSRKKEMASDCPTETSSTLSVRELREAETAIIHYVQSKTYHHEIKILNQEYKELHVAESRKNQLKKTSSIHRLDPYIDKGILRVGGRLNRALIAEESKHPPILPKSNHVTTLIIRDIHQKLGHAGRGHVLAMLRERFWGIKANSAVRQVISKCVTCRRSRGKPSEQKMADLPKDRVTPAPPFTHTGVDYFGPYVIKIGRKEVKRYGAIFTCLASRAVHIEIADSLETDSFIHTLRRFVARRGPVKMIRSDNGTNFVGAQAELRRALEEMNQDQIKDRLRKEEIEWIFNPPGASHMGGVWERQIGTIRKVLAGLLSEYGNRLDDESLRTLMCEVEAVINSRPLKFVSSDANDLEPLTPSHLLTTKSSIVLPPPGDFQKGEVYMKRRWRAIQFLTNVFWKRWRREYLLIFQQRYKWQNPRRSLKVGDVVIIKDDSTPRNSWPMGRVTAVERDGQEMFRAAIVKTERSELRRPANKLVLILAEEEQ